MHEDESKGALRFCFIFGNKTHGSALISKSQFEQIKSILYGKTEKAQVQQAQRQNKDTQERSSCT